MSAAGEKQKMTRAAGVVGAATLASRIGGFVRDMVIAYYFGTGAAADAFFVAFRIPNLLRRLFAEGSLTIAFIPIYTEVLQKKGREEAFILFRSTHGLMAVILLIITVAGIVFAEPVVRFAGMGFDPEGETFNLAVYLTRYCFPYIFFISLVALAGGVLNSMGHFFAPAVAPVLLNLAMIGTAICLTPLVDPPILSLALGVILGGVAQLALMVPYLRRQGVPLKPMWNPRHEALRRIGRLMGPAAFGAAVYQITVLMNTILASYLPSGSVSCLYFADRLIQFPLGIFAIAMATAVLPSLSRQAAEGDMTGLVDTMSYSLRLTMFINLPAMVGLIILAEPIVSLLFTRGKFDADSTRITASALVAYGVGLWAIAAVRSVVSTFYALKDTKTPVKVAAACLLVNLGFSLALMGPLAQVGLALATSISATVNFMALLFLLRKKVGRLGGKAVLRSVTRMLLACLAMSLAVWGVCYMVSWGDPRGPGHMVARPLVSISLGMAVYLIAAWVLKLEELRDILAVFLRKFSKSSRREA